MGFNEDLAAAKAAVDAGQPKKTGLIPVVVNGVEYEVVFYRPSQEDWSAAARKSPPRTDVPLDVKNGYDISQVARAISAEYGRVVDVNGERKMPPEEWADFWAVVALPTARVIEACIWYIVERDFEEEIRAAKKGSKPRPSSRKKSS